MNKSCSARECEGGYPVAQTMSIPVICVDDQSSTWITARQAMDADDGFLLVRCPAVLERLGPLANQFGPAVLISSSEFYASFEAAAIRDLRAATNLFILIVISETSAVAPETYLRGGCSGVLDLKDSPAMWRKAVQCVAAGELWFPRRVVADVVRELIDVEGTRQPRKLTRRETEILTLIAEGCSNRAVANRLFITKETVRWHLRTLYSKLGVNNRAAAASFLEVKERVVAHGAGVGSDEGHA